MTNEDNLLSNYDYDIPAELIAQVPAEQRSGSRLIVLDRKKQTVEHRNFSEVADMFDENDCLVVNTTKVVPARLYGHKSTGGKAELLFLEPTKSGKTHSVLLKPYIKPGQNLYFDDGYECVVGDYDLNGNRIVEFNKEDISVLLEKNGFMPLPPYIKRKDKEAEKMSALDRLRYQTVYASEKGAIAAPTAGLHFTKEIIEKLKSKKVQIAKVVLHVGWGTFKPIVSDNIKDHKMLPEKYILDEENAFKINKALESGKRIIAVGTTTVRSLESIAGTKGSYDSCGNLMSVESCSGQTDIFIYPGYKFKMVKAMFTNLHLPHSTPLMMVSALAGRNFILKAYKEAVMKKYRFFSYGDSMFIK
ncbi:MAG: tRNA preQ1(34) S-adenosylmethionine ribosyltransferase-isomerase QueA [Endomicrobiaceae bacterium]